MQIRSLGWKKDVERVGVTSISPEQYYFYRLYSIDLDDAKHILRVLKRYRRKDVRCCLLRDLVVTYCRPFSGNKGNKMTSHVLTTKVVPRDLRALHNELLSLRNQLFAHTDYTYRRPQVANWSTGSHKWFPMSFRGFDYNRLDAQVPEIHELVIVVEKNLQDIIDKLHETPDSLPDSGQKTLHFT